MTPILDMFQNTSQNRETLKVLQEKIEERLITTAMREYNSSDMKDTPFGGVVIHRAVATLSNSIRNTFKEQKDELDLSESKIDELVDDAVSNVLGKLLD